MPVVTFQVKGMTCQHCAQRVTQALERVAGIREPRVNLEGSSATVSATDEAAVDAAKAAVRQAGYEVAG